MGEELDDMTESMHGAMSLDGDPSKLRAFYDGWAADYDEDVGQNYGMPGMVAATLGATAEAAGWTTEYTASAVLDAGCGTGAVGQALHDAGWTNLSGIDLSPEMAALADARGIYRSVEGGVDLTVPVAEHLDGAADAVTLGGVFTVGHVPPTAIATMATLVRDGGLLVVSTRDAYQNETDWHQVIGGLTTDGLLEPLIHTANGPYTMDSTGDYWGWRVHR
jgi:predicted TPR repeat methyltransferase